MIGADDLCTDCGHPFDPHVLVALEYTVVAGQRDVPVGGVMFCPLCECTHTWSVQGHPVPQMPGALALALLRGQLGCQVPN